MQLNLRGYYILSCQNNPSIIRESTWKKKKMITIDLVIFSSFWCDNWINNDMSFPSSKQSTQISKIWLIYYVIWRNSIKNNNNWDPSVMIKWFIWPRIVLPWTNSWIHYVKTDLSDVICEEWSKFSGKSNKSNFEKHQSV